ncbi:MAG: DNA primase family protein, partial [Spirochaetota bacterium]
NDRRGGGASPEIARLYGVRFLEIEETQDGDRLHEARVKWLTGQDTLVARHLFQQHFEFRPTFTPVLITNHRPRISTGGKALWRRLRVIPFDFQISNRDPGIEERLREESQAVLAWLVEGARQWYARGMPDSETVNAAGAAYRAEEDRIGPFLHDATITVGETHRTELYRAYQRWCEIESERPMSPKKFNAAMRERGHEEIRDRVYGDIGLKQDWKGGAR